MRAKPGLVRLGGIADLRGDGDASLHFLDACIASGGRVNDLSPQVSAATLRQGWFRAAVDARPKGAAKGARSIPRAWPGICIGVAEDAVAVGEPVWAHLCYYYRA